MADKTTLKKADRLVAEDSRMYIIVIPIATNKGCQLLKDSIQEKLGIKSLSYLLDEDINWALRIQS